ncbi:MAG: pantothenate kinase, partial [Erythrobacter sp.]
MLLAADVGNTNVVFALFEADENGDYTARARWRI